MTRCGIVTVVGLPNAGKSTLLNRLLGHKLAITSPKAQSTRLRVVGILTSDQSQIVLVDTPGLIDPPPNDRLQQALRAETDAALAEADVILHIGTPDRLDALAELLDGSSPASVAAKTVHVINKADLLGPGERSTLALAAPRSLILSAVTGEGLQDLLAHLQSRVPEEPFLYPEDDLSSQNTRFFAAEFVRQAAFDLLRDELPWAVHVTIEEFREARQPVYVRAVIHVERESQKAILLGAGGRQIREVGRSARAQIEALLGAAVYLDLWVKVSQNWRRDPVALQRFGFRAPRHR